MTASTDWRPIPGYPLYEASSVGQIRRISTGLVLKTHTDARGYQKLTLCDADRRLKCVWLHRAVCAAFHGEPTPGQQARHRNGVKANCCASNLCWGSHSDNSADRVEHMRQRGLTYSGLSPQYLVRGSLSRGAPKKVGSKLGGRKTLHSIRQAFKAGLINKNKALELIKSL